MAASVPADSARARLWQAQRTIFILTWISYASFYLTRKGFGIVKARVGDELAITDIDLGYIDVAYLSAYAIGQFVNGALGDRLGARRMIAFGMISSALCAVAMGFGRTAVVFGIAFGLNGFFQSTGWPNNVKVMASWFGRSARGWVMGVWCTCYSVGGMAASAIATMLLVGIAWPAAFFVPAAWVSGVGMVILIYLSERPSGELRKLIDDDPETALDPKAKRAAFLEMVWVPNLWLLGGSYFGLKFVRYAFLFWLALYLTRSLGYSEEESGYMTLAFEAGGIIGAIVTGYLSDRVFKSLRAPVAAPMIFALVGAIFLYQATASIGPVAVVLGLALMGFLLYGPDALISGAAAQDIGGGAAAASAAGIINGLGSIGAILQSLLLPRIAKAYGWDAAFYLFAVLITLSGLLLLPVALRQLRRRRSPPQPLAPGTWAPLPLTGPIVSTIACLPVGVVTLVLTGRANRAGAAGDLETAAALKDKATWLIIGGFAVGVFALIVLSVVAVQ